MRLVPISLLAALLIGPTLAKAGQFETQVMVEFHGDSLRTFTVQDTTAKANTLDFIKYHKGEEKPVKSLEVNAGSYNANDVTAFAGWSAKYKPTPNGPKKGVVTLSKGQVYIAIAAPNALTWCKVYENEKCECEGQAWNICKEPIYDAFRGKLKHLAVWARINAKDALQEEGYKVNYK